MRLRCFLFALLLVAGCTDPTAQVDRMVSDYQARRPTAAVQVRSLAEAMQVQSAFVAALQPMLGAPVGYKAGLTSPAAQARFGMTHPLRGVLLSEMLQPSGQTLSAQFGTRPLFEGDLIVRVGSTAIHTAETDAELLAALDAVIPFLELPDLVYAPEVQLDGTALAAINVGARRGVVGSAVALVPSDSAMAQLAAIHVQLLDETGAVLAEADATTLLGHPLNAVRWLRDDLRAAGIALQPGDLLSLGSLTPLLPVRAGTTITARYWGLAPGEPIELTVTFE